MLQRFLLLLALLLTLVPSAHADPRNVTTYSLSERNALAQWVQQKASKKITLERSKKYVDQAYLHSFSNQLDPLVVLAMMKVESGFIETAKSYIGAKGLLQVWPKWHKDKLKGRDPFNPNVSIEVGSEILKDCIDVPKSYFQKVMKCYSGGAKNYANKVLREHVELSHVVAQALDEEKQTLAQVKDTENFDSFLSKLSEPNKIIVTRSRATTLVGYYQTNRAARNL